jgi:hypothetical protein
MPARVLVMLTLASAVAVIDRQLVTILQKPNRREPSPPKDH